MPSMTANFIKQRNMEEGELFEESDYATPSTSTKWYNAPNEKGQQRIRHGDRVENIHEKR